MEAENEHETVEWMSMLMLDIMRLPEPPPIPARFSSVEALQDVHTHLVSLRECLLAISNGDLSAPVPHRGFIAGTLKTLQANLRHLTWQTRMVASGDFTQRVDFMGDFAESFNAMVLKLDQTMKELVKREAELSETNDELLEEVAFRMRTEKALRESEKELKLQATTDPLTGLFNRRSFHRLAETEVSKFLRYSRPLSVMMIDIDHFKRVNDEFGHPSGDAVLKAIAEIVRGELRVADIPARYGGEEFVVLLPETPAAGAAVVAERLRTKIESTTVQAEGQRISVTASLGVSDCRKDPGSGDAARVLSGLVSAADHALYESKNAGRNRVTIYRPDEGA